MVQSTMNILTIKPIVRINLKLYQKSNLNILGSNNIIGTTNTVITDNLIELNSSLSHLRDAANSISFVSDGALGVMENVDSIEDLSSLKPDNKNFNQILKSKKTQVIGLSVILASMILLFYLL